MANFTRSGFLTGLWSAAWLLCIATSTINAAERNPPPQAEAVVLTLREAADLLRIDVAELERLAENKELPARRVGSVWRFNRESLMTWLNGEWLGQLSKGDLSDITGSGMRTAQAQTAPAAPPSPGPQEKPIGDAPEGPTAEQVFLRGRKVLLGRGEVVVDVGQFYARSDDLQLLVTADRLGLVTLQQEALTTVLQGRVGIMNETELFAATTLNTLNQRLLAGTATLDSRAQTQLGDVGLGVNRTLLREGARRPDIIATVRVLIPTHGTSSGVGAGLAVVKSIDPAVVFASGNYFHAFDRESLTQAGLDPRGTVDASIGYSLGLNDSLAISTTFSGLFTGGALASDGTLQRQREFFAGRFSMTSRLAQGLYIEPSVSFGLSGPRDSFAFGITVPYSF